MLCEVHTKRGCLQRRQGEAVRGDDEYVLPCVLSLGDGKKLPDPNKNVLHALVRGAISACITRIAELGCDIVVLRMQTIIIVFCRRRVGQGRDGMERGICRLAASLFRTNKHLGVVSISSLVDLILQPLELT